MSDLGTLALILAASCSAVAALAHLACVAIGAPAYRVMGAGEKMARAVEAGRLRPTLVTLAITGVLLLWSAYALAGAGVIGGLPLVRLALPAISALFLTRAVAFPLLKPVFPGNSDTFWWVSSAICGTMGLLYLVGTLAVWEVV